MSNGQMPDDLRDARDVLQALGIDWRTESLLAKLHGLTMKSLFVVRQVMGAFSLVDSPNALPLPTMEIWIETLLQTAVEAVLFPDPLPAGAKTWDALGQIWDEYIAEVKAYRLSGVRAFSECHTWSIRGAVRAAWNIELAQDGHPVEIGPVVSDSYHRAAIRSVSDLWLAYSHYVEASDNPANRPALWDAFVGRWKPEKVSRDCEFAGANLASELRRLRERLGFLPQSPAASATATAVAQASVGNVVIHNHIVIPGATAAERESKPPGEPAQAEGKIPAKSGKRAKPGRKRLEHFTLEYIRMTETSYERRRRRLLAGLP